MAKSNVFFWLLLLAFFTQVQTASAATVSKTYMWSPPSDNQETFKIYLETEESWQHAGSLEVFIKFTLIANRSSLDRVDIEWTRIEITDRQTFLDDSGKIEETASLRNIGEYYERKIRFQSPPIKLARGQNISASVIWNIQIDIVDNSQRHRVYTGSNSLDPLKINIFRPFLSTNETILIAIGSIATVIAIIISVPLYKKRKTYVKTKLQRTSSFIKD